MPPVAVVNGWCAPDEKIKWMNSRECVALLLRPELFDDLVYFIRHGVGLRKFTSLARYDALHSGIYDLVRVERGLTVGFQQLYEHLN